MIIVNRKALLMSLADAKRFADSKSTMPFVIGVNGKYALQALERIDSALVWIGMNDELDPLVFKASRCAEDLHVVMPMRL